MNIDMYTSIYISTTSYTSLTKLPPYERSFVSYLQLELMTGFPVQNFAFCSLHLLKSLKKSLGRQSHQHVSHHLRSQKDLKLSPLGRSTFEEQNLGLSSQW